LLFGGSQRKCGFNIFGEQFCRACFARGVEIEVVYSSFDSRQRDRLLQFDPRVTGSRDWHTTSGYCDNDGESYMFHLARK
jgi:hypothetical protein